VNFPDHTKLVLSSDASHCNFICLSVEAAACLQENGVRELPWKHIRERVTLQGSLQQLLYGSADKMDDPTKEVTESNVLRGKLEFVMSVVDGWIQGGGMGCLLKPQTFTWRGQQVEDTKKPDWASVGRHGGDVV
jgi:myosin I